jgi:hypothetical protein
VPAGNVLLDEIFGARIWWIGDADGHQLAMIAKEAAAEIVPAG